MNEEYETYEEYWQAVGKDDKSAAEQIDEEFELFEEDDFAEGDEDIGTPGFLPAAKPEQKVPPPPVKKEPKSDSDAEGSEREIIPSRRKKKFGKPRKTSLHEHNVFTHFPKDPNCDICNSCKITREQCRTPIGDQPDGLPKPTKFGESITADHAVVSESDKSKEGDRAALVMQDRYTHWLYAQPLRTKDHKDAKEALAKFMPPGQKPWHTYTDDSPELKRACRELEFPHDTATPYRPQTNGVAERAVKRVKEGTSCALAQSGLNEAWWSSAMMCYCMHRDAVDIVSEGKTPYELRFGIKFGGPLIPFGAEINYHPIRQKDTERLHKFGEKVLSGIFMGYCQQVGGGWNGDIYILDWEELANAQHVSQVHLKRFKATEINVPKIGAVGDKYRFPVAEGFLKQPGNERVIRIVRKKVRPVSDTEDTEGAEEEEEEEEELVLNQEEQFDPEVLCGAEDFWTVTDEYLIRHHRTPRKKLFIPGETPASKSPVPMYFLDVQRRTETDIDNPSENVIRDYWPDDGAKPLSTTWCGATYFHLLMPRPPAGYHYAMGRLTKTYQGSTRPPNCRPEEWQRLGSNQKVKNELIAEWEVEKKKLNQIREQYAGGQQFVSPSQEEEYQRIMKQLRFSYALPPAPAMPVVGVLDSSPTTTVQHLVTHAGGKEPVGKPTTSTSYARPHQERIASAGTVSEEYLAMVHKSIPLKQGLQIPDARAALDAEYTKLRNYPCWDESQPREREDVEREAREQGKTVHFGTIMDLIFLKHAELAKHLQKYKGRVVFRGEIVKDESGFMAVFSEQGTSASHLSAGKFLDALARMPGMAGQDADAVGAYCQVDLLKFALRTGVKITETWVSLPLHQQPASWKKFRNPVCPMRRALYGHPQAGLFWELFCHDALVSEGFEKVRGWECLYIHHEKGLLLSVYVDDFKMAGVKENLAPMWKALRKRLTLDEPTDMDDGVYLGCTQKEITPSEKDIQDSLAMFRKLCKHNVDADTQQFGMSDASSRSEAEVEANQKSKKKQNKKDKSELESQSTIHSLLANDHAKSKVRAYEYNMSGHAKQCVERYCELAKVDVKTLKRVGTPCIDDHALSPADFEQKGKLSDCCARIVLKALYLARMNRIDILWSVNTLAREVTRWTVACDKRLLRLISYLHFTQDWVQTCWVGDHPSDCHLALYADASFAGDLKDSKSTTGAFLCLVGPKTFVPITWICKKHGAVSHSSSEAEVISLDAAVRTEGIPALILWEQIVELFSEKKKKKVSSAGGNSCDEEDIVSRILQNVDYVPPNQPVSSGAAKLVILEDNDAVIKMCLKGRSPNMRHVPRTHRVDLDWLFERLREDPGILMRYIHTLEQIADILTKGVFTVAQWSVLCKLAQLGPSMNTVKARVAPCQALSTETKNKSTLAKAVLSYGVPTPTPSAGGIISGSILKQISKIPARILHSNSAIVLPCKVPPYPYPKNFAFHEEIRRQIQEDEENLAVIRITSSSMSRWNRDQAEREAAEKRTQQENWLRAHEETVSRATAAGGTMLPEPTDFKRMRRYLPHRIVSPSIHPLDKEQQLKWRLVAGNMRGVLTRMMGPATISLQNATASTNEKMWQLLGNTMIMANDSKYSVVTKQEFHLFATAIYDGFLKSNNVQYFDLQDDGDWILVILSDSMSRLGGRNDTKAQQMMATYIATMQFGRKFKKVIVKVKSGAKAEHYERMIEDTIKELEELGFAKFPVWWTLISGGNDMFTDAMQPEKHWKTNGRLKRLSDFMTKLGESTYGNGIIIGPGEGSNWGFDAWFIENRSILMEQYKKSGLWILSPNALFNNISKYKNGKWHFAANSDDEEKFMQCVMMCIEWGWSMKQVEDIVLNPHVPKGTACLDQSGTREDPLRPDGQGDRVANAVDLELEARAKEIEKENKRKQVEQRRNGLYQCSWSKRHIWLGARSFDFIKLPFGNL